MAPEIERKFLLGEDPAPRLRDQEGQRLRQGYLAVDGTVEVRVRISPESAVVTIKAGRGISRSEVEMPVSATDAEELWAHTLGRRIEKTRYRLRLADTEVGGREAVAEVDVYHGDLAGLFVAEVEFESDATAVAFTPPAWFSRELTGDERWSNANLARHGTPKEFIDELP